MAEFKIDWLNKCRCGAKSATVKTARGNELSLWDDDSVKCNACGREGVIQVCEGQARALWETDEERAQIHPIPAFTKDPSTYPANGPLTEDRLIRVRDELAAAAKRSDGGNLGYMMADAAKAIDELLAVRKAEQEPVYQACQEAGVWVDAEPDEVFALRANGEQVRTLYEAPQLPQPAVVPSNELLSAIEEVLRISDRDHEAWHRARKGIADFRAAMLQGAEPVSQPDELPLDYLQGHKDGLEWAARLAEANHPQTGDWLYDDPLELAKAIRKGPDMPIASVHGWIPCSERMPDAMISVLVTGDWFHHAVSFWDGASWCDLDFEPPVTHWMPLPAAPMQEVK